MRRKIFALIIASIVIGLFLNVGCKTSSNELTLIISAAEWFLEHDETGFGSILLRVSGYTNGERVTVLTFGDGFVEEHELQLNEDLYFNEMVTIAFCHVGYTPPVQAETTVTAYRGEEKVEVRLESGNIF